MVRSIKQSPKLPPEKRRAQLLASAKKLFVKKGYRVTTTEEIARKVGLTKGALYFHFKNKEDILLELIKSVAARKDESLESALAGRVSPDQFLSSMVTATGDVNEGDYAEVAELMVQGWRIPRIRKHIEASIKRRLEMFTERVDLRGIDARFDQTELGIMTFALFHGLGALRMMAPALVNAEQQVELYSRLLQSGTGASRTGGKKR